MWEGECVCVGAFLHVCVCVCVGAFLHGSFDSSFLEEVPTGILSHHSHSASKVVVD